MMVWLAIEKKLEDLEADLFEEEVSEQDKS